MSAKKRQELDLFSYQDYEKSADGQIIKIIDGIRMPVVGCMPGCKKRCNPCKPDYDYSKNYMHALNQRPGEFAEYNWLAQNFYLLQQEKQGVVCDGIKQTPINLETGVPILETFEDTAFEFRYADINPAKQLKYNQKGCQY